jgi:uncharacterized protein with von Willebrand factor type A (vWA) domain
MAAGRPTSYTEEVLTSAYDYLANYKDNDEVIPTVVGLCRHIGRGKTTVYNWAAEKTDEKAEFRDILEAIEENQHIGLVNGGLSNAFNPTITKMMMTKHGYSDKQEIDHSGRIDSTQNIKQISAEMSAEEATRLYQDMLNGTD